jgi:hypothetical protein
VESTTESRNYFLISGALIRCDVRECTGEATAFQPSESPDWNAAQENILAGTDRFEWFQLRQYLVQNLYGKQRHPLEATIPEL